MNSGPSANLSLHSKAAHISEFNLCHHQAICTFEIIYASAFFLAAFLGFASTSTTTVAGFLEAALLICSLIFFLLLDTPNEPIVLFPFAVFLSPLPIWI